MFREPVKVIFSSILPQISRNNAFLGFIFLIILESYFSKREILQARYVLNLVNQRPY